MITYMNYAEFKRQLGKAGIKACEFAELIKLNPNSITNYAKRGEVPSHLAIIVALMGEMAENGLDFRHALSRLEIEPNRPRGAAAKGRFGGSRQNGLFR
jgi:23S rRNA maturation-related 3'-5' exoribonuclease YhaM